MTHLILSNIAASISELKKQPMQTIKKAKGQVVAILNRNEPVFYCVPPKIYEAMFDLIDDIELKRLIKERKNEKEIEVNLDDL